MNFCYFIIFFPLEKNGALHLNKLEFHSPKDALSQVCLKLAQWFWRRGFFKILLKYIHYFAVIFPWKIEQLNKESSSPNNALCQVWLKLAQWLNFINVFAILLLSPLGKRLGPTFEQLHVLHLRMLCAFVRLKLV